MGSTCRDNTNTQLYLAGFRRDSEERMAEVEEVSEVGEVEEENYQPPPEKSIDALMQADQDDEALQKYKMALLGQAAGGSGTVVVDESDPRKVIVKALALVVEGRDDEVIDLTQSLEEIKKRSFTLKEGVKFRIRIDFMVQREIVHGLKYVQTLKMSIPVDKMTHMVGSYAPKTEVQSYLTPPEDLPLG